MHYLCACTSICENVWGTGEMRLATDIISQWSGHSPHADYQSFKKYMIHYFPNTCTKARKP